MNEAAANRRLLLYAAAGFGLLLIVAALAPAPASAPELYPSSYSTASGGAEAAYDWLSASGYHVTRWLQPPTQLPNGADTTLVLFDPLQALSATNTENMAIARFLRQGGRVVTSGPIAVRLLGATQLPARAALNHTWRDYEALEPGPLTQAAPRIRMAPQLLWPLESAAPFVPLYGDPTPLAGNGDDLSLRAFNQTVGAAVITLPRGRGNVIWWGSSTPVTNAAINQPGNLQLLVNSVGGPAQTILWDEYFHGQRQSFGPELNALWRVGAAPILVLVLTLLWTFSRRSGPLQATAFATTRESPLEFSHHLAGLYERAHAATLALSVLAQAAALRRRPSAALAAALAAAREASQNEKLAEKQARALARPLMEPHD